MGCFGFMFSFFFFFVDSTTAIPSHRVLQSNVTAASPLQLHVSPGIVEIDNGIVKLSLINPTGQIAGVSYHGIGNILEPEFKDSQRGYWDIGWDAPGIGKNVIDPLNCKEFKIIAQTNDQIEVSFTIKWNPASAGQNVVPLNVDKRYIMLRGSSGFYAYAIFEHLEGWPALNIDRARLAFKLDKKRFRYMAISDERQRTMPTEDDRKFGKVLAYKEAVLLTNPSDPTLKGEVDDKYQYSCDNKDSHVHGWISSSPHVGFWVITPSDEFRAGGPLKPDLTSHVGPTSLSIFFSDHYAGPAFGVFLQNKEQWKKVFGPIFLYLNSDTATQPTTLWQDAKKQTAAEIAKWPYEFALSPDFPHSKQRGSLRGRLFVHDVGPPKPARSAYVGLAPPRNVGSWQDNYKGYQFWTETGQDGSFTITNVRAGTYNLYAWVPGIIGDFKHNVDIIIKPGSVIQIGNLVYNPPRNGPTLWEIGIPDRTASEFYVPDPAPGLVNKLYLKSTQKFRQYGLWDRYTDLYPKNDLIYTVGVSNYAKDWFFAHVTRRADKNIYVPTTWQISFNLRTVSRGSYTLRIALAAAHNAQLQVWINEANTGVKPPHFTTGRIGRENAIARHGIHARYWLFSVNVPGSQLLINRTNKIYIKQLDAGTPFPGVMYDYIRLEAPST
ncbi:rhamnogalacturonan endolyase [Salvia divinorum]